MKKPFIRQQWQSETIDSFMTHDEAINVLIGMNSLISQLSIEQVALGYARARGFIQDNAVNMLDPLIEESTLQ